VGIGCLKASNRGVHLSKPFFGRSAPSNKCVAVYTSPLSFCASFCLNRRRSSCPILPSNVDFSRHRPRVRRHPWNSCAILWVFAMQSSRLIALVERRRHVRLAPGRCRVLRHVIHAARQLVESLIGKLEDLTLYVSLLSYRGTSLESLRLPIAGGEVVKLLVPNISSWLCKSNPNGPWSMR
jgi:hypothetical protein